MPGCLLAGRTHSFIAVMYAAYLPQHIYKLGVRTVTFYLSCACCSAVARWHTAGMQNCCIRQLTHTEHE